MSTAVAPRSRGRRGRRDDTARAAPTALEPVALALQAAARSRAEERIALAKSEALAEEAAARREADRLVEQATAEASESAHHVAAARVAAARREAREIVLAARRRAYDAVREEALRTLIAGTGSPGGRRLKRRINELVSARIGENGAVVTVEDTDAASDLSATAKRGHRRAELEASDLVDAVLETMPGEIEQLWT